MNRLTCLVLCVLAAANGVGGAAARAASVEKNLTEEALKPAKQLLPEWVKEFNATAALLRAEERSGDARPARENP